MRAKMHNCKIWITETRPDVLIGYFRKSLLSVGFNLCNEQYQFFTPFGFTALFLLSESHFAIHTFPERGKTYIELTSCVQKQFDAFEEILNGKEFPFGKTEEDKG